MAGSEKKFNVDEQVQYHLRAIVEDMLQVARLEAFGCFIKNPAYEYPPNGYMDEYIKHFIESAKKHARNALIESSFELKLEGDKVV